MQTENINRKSVSVFDSYKWKRFKTKHLSLSGIGNFAWKIVRAVIVLGLCFIILYPFFIKIVNAFKGYNDFQNPTVRFIPKEFTIMNIVAVIEKMDYWKALLNTSFVSLGSAVMQMFTSAFIGYGLARFKFKGNGAIFAAVIATLIIPPQTIIIPIFLRFRFFLGLNALNLIDTPFPMFIMALTGMGLKNGLYIFLFRQLFRNMPKELEEAAYLDGCGTFQTYFRVMVPGAGSMFLTVFLLAFSWQWTDTVYNGLFFSDGFPVLANLVLDVGSGETGAMSSNYIGIASLLTILPVGIIYAFTQKFFVQSIDRSGIVG